MSHPTTWGAGFAALELAEASERMVALWHSSDGMSWRRDPVPTGLRRGVWDLVAFRDRLVLVRGATVSRPFTIRHELWATSDGRHWNPLGDFRTSLDARLRPDWRLGLSAIEATDDTLALFAEIIPCCGSGGWHPGTLIASIDGIAAAQRTPYGGLLVWTSPDGDRWTRHRAPGFTDSVGKAYLDQLAPDGAGGLLATRLGDEAAVLQSPDGVRWTVIAPLPEQHQEGGSEGLIVPTRGLMVFGDADGRYGFGNPLGAWSLEPGGTWLRVIDQQPASTHSQAAAGDTVIVVGSSWDPSGRAWPWVLVSLDGGHTWEAGLSWSGADGSCVGDVAVRERMAVMVGCQHGEPAMWATQLPGSTPVLSPGP